MSFLCARAVPCPWQCCLRPGPATSQAVAGSQLDERDCLMVINVWRLTRALRGSRRASTVMGTKDRQKIVHVSLIET